MDRKSELDRELLALAARMAALPEPVQRRLLKQLWVFVNRKMFEAGLETGQVADDDEEVSQC